VQIAGGGWGAHYPAATHFFDVKLSCRAYRPASPTHNNEAGFCDPCIDARAERSRRLSLSDPHAANRLWQTRLRDILNQAR
jgi:hypothetical protein